MSSSTSQFPSIEESNSIAMSEDDLIHTNIDKDQVMVEEVGDIPELEEGKVGTENKEQEEGGEAPSGALEKKSRAPRSKIWASFTKATDVKGITSVKCNYCSASFSWQKTGTTSHLARHMNSCLKMKLHLKKQQLLNF